MKFSKTIVKKLSDIPTTMYRQLYGLNRGRYGWNMRPTLVKCRKLYSDNSYIIYITNNKDGVVAWALLTEYPHCGPSPSTYFYTRPAYRRKGFGSRIARMANETSIKKYKKLTHYYVHGGNEIALPFFKTCIVSGYLEIERALGIRAYKL